MAGVEPAECAAAPTAILLSWPFAVVTAIETAARLISKGDALATDAYADDDRSEWSRFPVVLNACRDSRAHRPRPMASSDPDGRQDGVTLDTFEVDRELGCRRAVHECRRRAGHALPSQAAMSIEAVTTEAAEGQKAAESRSAFHAFAHELQPVRLTPA